MKNYFNFILFSILFFALTAKAQVGIGTSNPDSSSLLDITSTSKGFLLPRLTTAERNLIASPATGLMIFNSSNNQIEFNSGSPASPIWTASVAVAITTASNGLTTALGDVKLGGALTASTTISAVTATNKLSVTATGVDAINLDSNTLSIDATNDRVGIGTASPGAKLAVNGGVIVDNNGQNVGTLDNQNSLVFGGLGSGEVIASRRASGGNNPFGLDFYAGSSNRMAILNGGNIGIGTTAPAGKLHIFESTGTTLTGTAASLILEHNNTGGQSSILFKSRVNSGSDYGYIKYTDDGSGNGSTNENSLLEIGTQNDPVGSFQDDIALMPSGNVGVGTITPLAKLDINGTIKISGGAPALNKVLISDATGIGSWSTLASLGVATASNGLTVASGDVKLGGAITGATTISGLTATNKLNFTATGVDAINLDSNTLSIDATNDRVGIGTATPTANLHVNGSVRLNALADESSNSAYNRIAMTDSNGNVGYKSAPTYNVVNYSYALSAAAFDTGVNASNFLPILIGFNFSANIGCGSTGPAIIWTVSSGNWHIDFEGCNNDATVATADVIFIRKL